MKAHTLVPLKHDSNNDPEGPAEKMRARLERHTKYWPITISNTIMFNLKQVINRNFSSHYKYASLIYFVINNNDAILYSTALLNYFFF